MSLEQFADNPIIDELLWLQESGRSVVSIRAVVSESEASVRYVCVDSLEHSVSLEPGLFAQWWSDAADVLTTESSIKPLDVLAPRLRRLLEPAEARIRQVRLTHQLELEHRRLVAAVGEADEAFRLHQYSRVLSLLGEFEPSLDGVAIRRLRFARRKLAGGAASRR